MGRVAELLSAKGSQVHTIQPGKTVFEAVRAMVDHNVGSLLVVEGGQVLGIVTERDYLREIVLKGRTSRETRVDDIMTRRVVCVDPDRGVAECMAMMTEQRIRHLPVLEEGKLVGLVSIGDAVRHISRDQQYQIRYLTDYITGKYPA